MLPLFKSSRTSVWPVLCLIENIKDSKVFPISFSVGQSKPLDLDFLIDLFNDLSEISNHGLSIDEKKIPLTIVCIICHAPVKELVKNFKQYSGYYGCDRYNQKGLHLGRWYTKKPQTCHYTY